MSEPDVPKLVIATLLHERGTTGVQSHFNALRDHLGERRTQALVVTPYAVPKWLVYPVFALRRLINPVSGACSVWWYRYWHERFLAIALRSLLSTAGDVVVYAQCPLSARAALAARRTSQRQRVVLVVHFNDSQADEWAGKRMIREGGWYFEAIRRLEAQVLPSLDGIVFVSRFMRDRLLQRIPQLGRVASAVIPNFCDPVRNVAVRPADLITIGTLEPRKNQAFLLQVLARAQQIGKRYTLDIVGDGPDRKRLEQLAQDIGVRELVRFLGYQPQASGLIAGHRIYVHAAQLENCPVTLIEALSCGVPVLAGPVGGVPELIEHGTHGFHWPLNDAQRAAELLINIMEDHSLHASMSAAASRKYQTEFASTVVATRLVSFLQRI